MSRRAAVAGVWLLSAFAEGNQVHTQRDLERHHAAYGAARATLHTETQTVEMVGPYSGWRNQKKHEERVAALRGQEAKRVQKAASLVALESKEATKKAEHATKADVQAKVVHKTADKDDEVEKCEASKTVAKQERSAKAKGQPAAKLVVEEPGLVQQVDAVKPVAQPSAMPAKTKKVLPYGSDIWNSSQAWTKMERWHPAGVISNVNEGAIEWNDVSFISWRWLIFLSMLTYPVIPIAVIMIMTVTVSMMLNKDSERSARFGQYLFRATNQPMLAVEALTHMSRILYGVWQQFCHMVPALLVFGVPMLLVAVAWEQPQEMLTSLSLLTSVICFMTMTNLSVHANSALFRMARTMEVDWSNCKEVREQMVRDPSDRVQHYVFVPQYKEDTETSKMMLESIAKSSISTSMINVVLAMEERETDSKQKARLLMSEFAGRFRSMDATYHPPNLPNDPPGKASNVAYSFKTLMRQWEGKNVDYSKHILTIADADSEFHPRYFECLTHTFMSSSLEKRETCIFQSPIYHMKNYHRQPCMVVVGTALACLHELAALGDPHAVRFPYSTYSLSCALASRVGGWDTEWIAEDWHMGIKCFLLTLGECRVEPVMLPTINYTPEDTTWWSTLLARWTQAKRHALGFSDLTYYFMTLPLVFAHCVTTPAEDGSLRGIMDFLRMLCKGIPLCMKIVNIHVLLGVLSTYCAFSMGLKFTMEEVLRTDRHIMVLVSNLDIITKSLCCVSCAFMVFHSGTFLRAYSMVVERIEDKPWEYTLPHLLYVAGCLVFLSPIFALFMVAAVWKAALTLVVTKTFEYEVALKPTSQTALKA